MSPTGIVIRNLIEWAIIITCSLFIIFSQPASAADGFFFDGVCHSTAQDALYTQHQAEPAQVFAGPNPGDFFLSQNEFDPAGNTWSRLIYFISTGGQLNLVSSFQLPLSQFKTCIVPEARVMSIESVVIASAGFIIFVLAFMLAKWRF